MAANISGAFKYYAFRYTSNSDGPRTVADSNSFFESLGNCSDSSRKHICRDILGKVSYFIMETYVVCTP